MKSALASLLFVVTALMAVAQAASGPLDPRGKVHIPIGLPDALDSLKTFVEAEGGFSPGFGTYGVSFWVWDARQKKLFAPTMDGVKCEHGLAEGGLLIPWSKWQAGAVGVRTEVCQVQRTVETNTLPVVGARVQLTNTGADAAELSLFVALRPLGPAGGPVPGIGFSEVKDTLAISGFPAIVANERAQSVGAATNDTIGEWALRGELPAERYVNSAAGACSGAFRFDLALAPGQARTFGFTCPVLPNRWAARHKWDGVSTWAQSDLSRPNTTNEGVFQRHPGLRFYRLAKADALFAEAANFWREFTGRVSLKLPDPRWAEGFAAMLGHSALCMNEGAPDVAVANYNVFNRDGAYLANIFQKSGRAELSGAAIDYFLSRPFNGRVQPEADNPGQILWAMGEHWRFTRDRQWLERTFPSAQKIAAIIRYYRTTPGPHFVSDTSLDFGDALPAHQRKELKPGACDGVHPEYTEAWDIAGLRGAVLLAEARGQPDDATAWRKLAQELLSKYDARFGGDLAKEYGSYSVLWPCRLYPLGEGKGFEKFKSVGAQKPSGWRYFPLARAHQGLLAGNRAAAAATLAAHFDHPQMRGWYAFDEGGDSGVGGWNHVLTTWRQGKASDAMPHGWAIAEVFLLLRDALAFEDGDKLILFGGVPAEWFRHPAGMRVENLPTHFGKISVAWTSSGNAATLALSGDAAPAGGMVLRLPASTGVKVIADGVTIAGAGGDFTLSAGTTSAQVEWPAE